jgi:hypothetical protein
MIMNTAVLFVTFTIGMIYWWKWLVPLCFIADMVYNRKQIRPVEITIFWGSTYLIMAYRDIFFFIILPTIILVYLFNKYVRS